MTLQSTSDAIQALERASQKHEKEIVVELVPDRVLHYIGVYVLIFVAIVAKITEVADSKLSCYPARNTTPKSGFIAYSESYCWETSQLASAETNNSCNLQDFGIREEILMKDPERYKTFMQWLPYVMLLEAFLFSIPSVAWHFRVGARLMGHLKFIKLLLNDVYETVKPIPNGIYRRDGAYDRKGYYLDGWSPYDDDYKYESFRTRKRKEKTSEKENIRRRRGTSDPENGSCCAPLMKMGKISTNKPASKAVPLMKMEKDSTNKPATKTNKNMTKKNCFTQWMYGDIRDRHLFSMLCFENFSSLEQQPYILSVYKLSAKYEKASYKGDTVPKTKGILRLVCNENNFSERFLITTYYIKHGFGILVSLVAFIATAIILKQLWPDVWTSESFQCDVIYHEEECVICTLKRKRDMLAFLFINLIIDLLYVALSLWQVMFLRSSANRAICKYFEEIADTGSVALTEIENQKATSRPNANSDKASSAETADASPTSDKQSSPERADASATSEQAPSSEIDDATTILNTPSPVVAVATVTSHTDM